MSTITLIGVVAGSAVVLVSLIIALRRNEFPKNAVVFLGIGAFLIAGSQWSSFKVSEGGFEVIREKLDSTSKAVSVTQSQVANLSTALEGKNLVSASTLLEIHRQLAAAPPSGFRPIDLTPKQRILVDPASTNTGTQYTPVKKR